MIHRPAPTIPPGFISHVAQLLQKVQRGLSPIELIYMDHEHWPLRPGRTIHNHPTLHISILDSSFNPPTLAHLALANSPPTLSFQSEHPSITSAATETYDARMLLLSVRNADKVLRPRDATLVQRLEMMRLLLYDIRSTNVAGSTGEHLPAGGNTAIVIVDEPTFVGKSTILLRFLQKRLAAIRHSIGDTCDSSHPFLPKLTFLLGFDTLTRLFSPKYYPSEQEMICMLRTFLSPDQEDCRVVCAYRQGFLADKTLDAASEFIAGGRVAFIDIGGEGQTYSSTKVRSQVAAGDERWKRLVTSPIADYIVERQVYSDLERE